MIARHLVRLAIVLVAAISSACAVDAQSIAVTGTFERTLDVTGPVNLDVKTGSGSVRVRRGSGSQVRVVGHIRAQRGFWNSLSAEERVRGIEQNPPVAQNGNSIDIGELERRDLGRNVSISYELTVPDDTRLHSRTGSGSHDIDSIHGPVEAETGSGSIHVGRIGSSVIATTGSGSIEVLGASDGLTASTGSGSVTARQMTGTVKARSGSGRINIEYAGAGDGDFGTGSGSITVAGANGRLRAHAGSGSITVDGNPSNDWSIDTGSGSVTVRLPPTAAFDLDASTGSGSVSTRHPIETLGALSRKHLQGRVRGGGPRLQVSASSGSIQLD